MCIDQHCALSLLLAEVHILYLLIAKRNIDPLMKYRPPYIRYVFCLSCGVVYGDVKAVCCYGT